MKITKQLLSWHRRPDTDAGIRVLLPLPAFDRACASEQSFHTGANRTIPNDASPEVSFFISNIMVLCVFHKAN
jgi:hypothetical protein